MCLVSWISGMSPGKPFNKVYKMLKKYAYANSHDVWSLSLLFLHKTTQKTNAFKLV